MYPCQDLFKERRRPELAWVLYTEILQGHSQAARDAKIKDLPTAALPQASRGAARPRRRASAERAQTELEPARLNTLTGSPCSTVHDGGKMNRPDGDGLSVSVTPLMASVNSQKWMDTSGNFTGSVLRAGSEGNYSVKAKEIPGDSGREGRQLSPIGLLRSLNSPPVPTPLTSTNLGPRRSLDPVEQRGPGARRSSESNPNNKLDPPTPHALRKSIVRTDAKAVSTAAQTSVTKGNEAIAGDVGAGSKPARTQTLFRPPTRPEQLTRQDSASRMTSASRGDTNAVVTAAEQNCSSEANLKPLKKAVPHSAVKVREAESVRALATCALFQSVPEGAVSILGA